MSEVHIEQAAEKDLKRMGPGPERTRIVAGLRRLAQDAPNLDVKPTAAAPGWFRLRIGDYRVCYYRTQRDRPSGPVTIYAVERIVPRGAFDAVAASLPEQR
ncbi:MAG: type II toxin-antitoxin system RelE family toxin [Pseudonocardiaceae bacterium]